MRHQLERSDGPECPRCGCQDTEIMQPRQTSSQRRGKNSIWENCILRGERVGPENAPPSWQGPAVWNAGGMARCRHCGYYFGFSQLFDSVEDPPQVMPPEIEYQDMPPIEPDDGIVRFVCIRCPGCDSKNVRVTSKRGEIRYHKCQDCGANFKSKEK